MGLLVMDGRAAFGKPLSDMWFALRDNAERFGVVLPRPDVVDGTAVIARVDHNRWIADCPDCSGAEYVWLSEPIFMCQSCWNARIDHHWRPVGIVTDWRKIVDVLTKRPMPANRNWTPGETIDALRAENAKHGDPI